MATLRESYSLAIHNIKSSRERQESQFSTYPLPDLHVEDKVLVRNHSRNVWDSKYDNAYHALSVLE